jgi:hypothetical protein
MEIIDDEGRLFGRVNVIDALVVLFVLAVLVAGVALVTGLGGSADTEPTGGAEYATLTVGPLSGNTSAALADSGNLTIVGTETRLEVVDAARTPHPTQDASVAVLRVRVPEGSDTANLNQSFDVTDGQLSYNASLSGFTNETEIETRNRSLIVEASVPERVSGTVEPGDTHRIAGDTVATVTNVQRLGRQSGQRQLRVALDVTTVRVDGIEQFAQRSLRLGTALPFRTDSYSMGGAIVSLDGDGLASENVTVRAETTVQETVAENVDAGDSYAVGPTTVATIETVSSIPTETDSESRLLLNLSLRTATFDNETTFLGRSLRPGTTVPFETDEYTLRPTITSLDPEALERRTLTTRLQTTVPTTVADSVTSGDQYRINERTVAEIESVTAQPAGGDRRQLSLTMSLQTIVEDETPEFLGNPVRVGSSVPFETAEYTLQSTIVSLDPEPPERRTLTTRLQTTVSQTVADSVTSGDQYRINERTVAEIESVTAYPVAGSSRQRLSMAVALQTTIEDGTPQFLGSPVRVGSTVPFETSSYGFRGTVVSQNGSRIGQPVDATLEVDWENIRPSLADSVSPGMTETHRGADATITAIDREPATEILRTETGEIFARDHPVNEDVQLTLSVEARQAEGTLSFHGRQVQSGDSVVLDFGSVTVRGTVSDIDVDG